MKTHPKGGRGRIGKKRLGGEGPDRKEVTFDEWLEGSNAQKFATRDQLVAYSQFQLREQIMPMVGEAIKAYDAEIRYQRWYRRFDRWLKGLFVRKQLEVADLPADARAELRAELDAAEVEPEPEERKPVRTCPTCGSAQLEPVNASGGLQCQDGHVIEDPPLYDPSLRPSEEQEIEEDVK